MQSASTYEPGMQIGFDPATGKVTVAFRGRLSRLAGLYSSEDDGRAAGEAYCRRLGWRPRAQGEDRRSLLGFRRAS